MTEVQQGSLAEEIERMVHAFSDATHRQRIREIAAKVAELEASEQRHVREWADAIREDEWKRDEATRMRDALETRAEQAEAEVARLRGVIDRAHADSMETLGIIGRIEHAQTGQAYYIHRAGAYVTMLPDTDNSCAPTADKIDRLRLIGGDCWWRDAILALLAAPAAEGE